MNKHKPRLTRKEKIVLLRKRDGNGCFYQFSGCQYPTHIPDDSVTFDHYIPQSQGGTWDLPNLRLACRRCNNRKADRIPDSTGSIPPPPPRQQRRSQKRATRTEPCHHCYTGRMLTQGETCITCGRLALPPERNHLYKMKTWECPHDGEWWCIACAVYRPEERVLASAS